MRRFTVTQKGQPIPQIPLDARRANTPSGYVVPPSREGTYGRYAADELAQTQYLLSGAGLHPTTVPLMPLGALDIDIEQAPLYRVPTSEQIIHSAMNHPTNRGSRVVSESLGNALARAGKLYF